MLSLDPPVGWSGRLVGVSWAGVWLGGVGLVLLGRVGPGAGAGMGWWRWGCVLGCAGPLGLWFR